MPGRNALSPWITPHTFTAKVQRQSESGSSQSGASSCAPTPALLQSTCTLPCFATTASASACTDSERVTSQTTPETSARLARASSAALFSSAAASTSASTTFMPARASRAPSARPMPDAPPVTTATLPAKSFMDPPVFPSLHVPERPQPLEVRLGDCFGRRLRALVLRAPSGEPSLQLGGALGLLGREVPALARIAGHVEELARALLGSPGQLPIAGADPVLLTRDRRAGVEAPLVVLAEQEDGARRVERLAPVDHGGEAASLHRVVRPARDAQQLE